MSKIDKIYQRLVNVIFILGILLPCVLFFVSEPKEISETENRTLKQFPVVPVVFDELSEFFKSYSEYYKDQFGLRDTLVGLHQKLLRAVGVRDRSIPVIRGRNNWLFLLDRKIENNHLAPRLFTKRQLESWKRDLEEKHKWLKERNIGYLFVVPPDKHTIYPEYLPDWFHQNADITKLEQLYTYLSDNTDVPILDLRDTFLSAKQDMRIYHKHDTHWNLAGANHAQYEIVQRINQLNGESAIDTVLYSVDDFLWKEERTGDLARMLGLSEQYSDSIPKFKKKRGSCFSRKTKKRKNVIKWGNGGTIIDLCENNEITVLIFRDSYMNMLRRYLSDYFYRTVYVWKYEDFCHFKSYVQREKPDFVIDQRIERNLYRVPRNDCLAKAD